ncbi:MAG: GNAT family N-acetyltransferase [Gammaproteobacteria bacterium]|nr:MAG: GNAT family N-acetyltransferase [Gammaproteobacteria bacterium]
MIENYDKITKVLASSLGLSVAELVRCYDRATTADFAALCELMCLGFGMVDNLSPEIIAWRYFDFTHNISDIFVLRYQGQLIGAVGAEPINIKVGDREYQGIRAADIVVHPDHGKRGIGAWMNLHLQHTFPIVMAMGSNERSDTMVRRLFRPMNCRHHFKILFSIKNYLGVRGWPAFLIKLISPPAALALFLLRKPHLVPLPQDYELAVSDNTEQLKLFFNSSHYQPRSANIALRSAEFCRWRYDLNPKSHFGVLHLHHKRGLVGYAIIKLNDSEIIKDFQLMDWDLFPEYRDEKHLRMLFSAAVNYALKQGAPSLCVMTSDQLSRNSLRKTGFSLRSLDDGFFLFAKGEVPAEVFDERKWFLSFCDTDEAL